MNSGNQATLAGKMKDFQTIQTDLQNIGPPQFNKIGLASKLRDSAESNRVGAATYHTLNPSSQTKVQDQHMQTIQRHRLNMKMFGGSQTAQTLNQEYHALGESTFISPALQRKTRGFIDFDLQLFRPEITKSNCHEKRLEPFNYFPVNISNNKPVRQVDFNKIRARDNLLYRDTKCSDFLFDPRRHLNVNHKKEMGILQFSKIGHMRGDEDRRMAKMKEYARPQDNLLSDMLNMGTISSLGGGTTKSMSMSKGPKKGGEIDLLGMRRPQAKSNRGGISFNKQYGRVEEVSSQPKRIKEMSTCMPVHMQNMNNRLAMNQHTFTALKSVSYQPKPQPEERNKLKMHESQRALPMREPHEFLDPASTFNTRKDFWIDPKKAKQQKIQKAVGATTDKQKKKNLTFNQLLSKFGYIQDDGFEKKERVRPWHVQKLKEQLSDSESSDEG